MAEIQNLKARYCEAVDGGTGDPTAMRIALGALFAEDMQADYGTGMLQGRAAVIEYLAEVICRPHAWLYHSLHTPLVEVDGDLATGRWTIIAYSRLHSSPDKQTQIGRYRDRFVRATEGWRFSLIQGLSEG